MAAPTQAYNDTTKNQLVVGPPWKETKTLTDGQVWTITLLNVTQTVKILSDADVKYATHAGGAAAGAYSLVKGGTVPYNGIEQTSLLVITNNSGGNAVVSVSLTLSTARASDWPALTEANGFDGVHSHYSSVAV